MPAAVSCNKTTRSRSTLNNLDEMGLALETWAAATYGLGWRRQARAFRAEMVDPGDLKVRLGGAI